MKAKRYSPNGMIPDETGNWINLADYAEELADLKRKLSDALVWKTRLDEAAGVVEKQEREIERLKRLMPLPPTGIDHEDSQEMKKAKENLGKLTTI